MLRLLPYLCSAASASIKYRSRGRKHTNTSNGTHCNGNDEGLNKFVSAFKWNGCRKHTGGQRNTDRAGNACRNGPRA